MIKLEYIDVYLLKFHPTNPRLIKDKAFKMLCESIKNNPEYFEARPCLYNKDMVVFAGNMRLRAAIENGLQSVPAVMLDISPEKERELMIRDNVQNGEWDASSLAANFDIAELESWGVDMAQFGVFDDNSPEDVNGIPAIEKSTEIQEGNIFALGNHRLMCGDATSAADTTLLMGGMKAQMVFTDPPYNVDYSGGAGGDWKGKPRKKIKNDSMSDAKFYEFLRKVMDNLVSVTDGAFYICMSSSELHNLFKAFTDAGGHWQTYIIWAKNSFTLGRSDYQHQFEPIMHGLSDKAAEAVENTIDACPILYGWNKHAWYGGRKQGDVWMIDRPQKSDLHPTMKPVELCMRAIRNSSQQEEVVLDLFGGSGSTLIACESLNRRCYMMELDPLYVDVIIKRWEQMTGQKAVKIS